MALFRNKTHGAYRGYLEATENFRGRELGVPAAEAFVPLVRDRRGAMLPGL
jgi:hypothetical protein